MPQEKGEPIGATVIIPAGVGENEQGETSLLMDAFTVSLDPNVSAEELSERAREEFEQEFGGTVRRLEESQGGDSKSSSSFGFGRSFENNHPNVSRWQPEGQWGANNPDNNIYPPQSPRRFVD